MGEILRLGTNGRLIRIAGIRGPEGVYGVGGPATHASVDGANGMAFDRSGDLFISGENTKTLLMVDARGTMRLPAGDSGFYPRGSGGLVNGTHGQVVAMNNLQIVRLRPGGIDVLRDFGHRIIAGIHGFQPNGLAVGRDGTIYTDTWKGNGFASGTALIAIRPNGKSSILFQDS